jgi:hypothetical protein
MWLNFIVTALNFLIQGVGGRGLVNTSLRLQKTSKKIVPRSYEMTQLLHEITHAVIELFLVLFGCMLFGCRAVLLFGCFAVWP